MVWWNWKICKMTFDRAWISRFQYTQRHHAWFTPTKKLTTTKMHCYKDCQKYKLLKMNFFATFFFSFVIPFTKAKDKHLKRTSMSVVDLNNLPKSTKWTSNINVEKKKRQLSESEKLIFVLRWNHQTCCFKTWENHFLARNQLMKVKNKSGPTALIMKLCRFVYMVSCFEQRLEHSRSKSFSLNANGHSALKLEWPIYLWISLSPIIFQSMININV